jgi:outer membrane protein
MKPMRRPLIVRTAAFLFGAIAVSGAGPAAAAGELAQFADLAQANDVQLKLAAAQRDATVVGQALARSTLLPQVSASAGWQQNTIRNATSSSAAIVNTPLGGGTVVSGGDQTYSTTSYGASVQQALFNWTAIQGYRQSLSAREQGELDYRAAEQDLCSRLVTSYLAVLAAQMQLSVDRTLINSTETEVRRQQKFLDSGLGTTSDFLTAQAASKSAQAQLLADSNLQIDALAALGLIVGSSPVVRQELKDDLPLLSPNPNNLETWVSRALSDNITLASAVKAVEVADAQRKAATGGRLPQLVGFGGISSTHSDSTGYNSNSSYYVGVNLNVPLYAGGISHLGLLHLGGNTAASISAKVQQAQVAYAAALSKVELLRSQVRASVTSHFNGVVTGISQVKAALAAQQANEANVVALEASFKAGARSVTDSVVARANLATAQKSYHDARLGYLRSLVALKQDVGQLHMTQVSELDDLMTLAATPAL